MNIDRTAPLSTRQETFVAAPPEIVWGVEADIDHWEEWQPGVSSAMLEGELAVGTTFKWKAGGARITSTLQEMEPGRSIGWTGKSVGMMALHFWRFEPRDGGTQVITEESLSGWFPTILRIFNAAFLEKSLAGSLQALKDEAERRSTP